MKADMINIETLRRAIINVARKRGTLELFDNTDEILNDIVESDYLRNNWSNYRKDSYYVGDLEWADVLETTVNVLKNKIGSLIITV